MNFMVKFLTIAFFHKHCTCEYQSEVDWSDRIAQDGFQMINHFVIYLEAMRGGFVLVPSNRSMVTFTGLRTNLYVQNMIGSLKRTVIVIIMRRLIGLDHIALVG